MKKITLNGKRYIALGELDHLCHNLVRDIWDKYEKDENGQIHPTPEDVGAVAAYGHIRVEILHDELEQARLNANSPETLRAEYDKVYKKMRDEYIEDRYLIVGKDGEEKIYFRKMCPYAPKPEHEEGTEPTDEETEEYEDTPVFTSMRRLADSWTDHYQATNFCEYLKRRTKMDNLKVVPAWTQYMTGDEAKKLLDAIFRDDDEDDASGVGQAFSPD